MGSLEIQRDEKKGGAIQAPPFFRTLRGMVDAADADASPEDESSAWWEARRGRYNLGLVVAGLLGFVGYVVVLEVYAARIRGEVTLLTTALQGVGYLVGMALANVFYFAGRLGEFLVPRRWRPIYRRVAFAAGCVFSYALPLSIPVLLWVQYR